MEINKIITTISSSNNNSSSSNSNSNNSWKLFNTSCIENKDELEEKFERCYAVLQGLTVGLSEKEAHDALNNAVCKQDKTHEEVSLGLLVVILTDPQDATKSYRDLTLITRDGFAIVLGHLNQLVLERYLRLNDTTKSQLLWLLRELIRTNVGGGGGGVDNLCLSLLRHAAGGDISQRNIYLIETLLDIFQDNRLWLDKFPFLIASIVYTYLRLIEDHSASHLHQLRLKEINFTVTLIRERIVDCLVIGRDLIRLLQNVARLPEFENLWRDLLSNPKSINPNLTNGVLLQLLQTRTSRRFLQSRLTPDMERKLVFLTANVRFGNHKRYQDWFQRQYLATPESQSLRCDLIRFIVGVIHPTNELLCSDIIPRWAVIGWLLTTCTSNVAASNAKLALFYDWLFFDPDKDNIMNIEPAILVMNNSMRSHPAVTATLLDFLCRIIPNFYPALTDKVRNGIFSSLRQILEKRVLPSLNQLFDNSKLDRELRIKIRENFKEFCLEQAGGGGGCDSGDDSNEIQETSPPAPVPVIVTPTATAATDPDTTTEPAFSDDDDDEDNDDEDNNVSEFKSAINNIYNETDNESRCQIMERIVQMIIEDTTNLPTYQVAICLSTCNILSSEIISDIFPSGCSASTDDDPNPLNDELLIDSISTPIFVMFRNYFQLCKDEDNRKKYLGNVLAELQNLQSSVGYLLLYFLKVWWRHEEEGKREGLATATTAITPPSFSAYKDFSHHRNKKLEACLLDDLKLLHQDNVFLLCYLIPDIFMGFQNIALGNPILLHLVVSTVDSCQLQELVCQILQGQLKMLEKDSSFSGLLLKSLEWETFEQYCFWQIITAHDFPIKYILPVIPKLQFKNHAEAMTSILFMLKQEKPTIELLRQLFTRHHNHNDDTFVVAVLRYWCKDYEDKLSELLANLLSTTTTTPATATSPNKRKRTGAKQQQQQQQQQQQSGPPPTGEQVLGHLNQLRQHCRATADLQLYQTDVMQKALQQAQAASSDKLKKSFSDLFALAEENDPPPPPLSSRKNTSTNSATSTTAASGHPPKGHRKIISTRERTANKRPPPRDRSNNKSSDSTDQSSEDEMITKPKQAKKRKKINAVGSDSD